MEDFISGGDSNKDQENLDIFENQENTNNTDSLDANKESKKALFLQKLSKLHTEVEERKKEKQEESINLDEFSSNNNIEQNIIPFFEEKKEKAGDIIQSEKTKGASDKFQKHAIIEWNNLISFHHDSTTKFL